MTSNPNVSLISIFFIRFLKMKALEVTFQISKGR